MNTHIFLIIRHKFNRMLASHIMCRLRPEQFLRSGYREHNLWITHLCAGLLSADSVEVKYCSRKAAHRGDVETLGVLKCLAPNLAINAAKRGHLQAVKFLYEIGQEMQIFRTAVKNGRVDVAQFIVQHIKGPIWGTEYSDIMRPEMMRFCEWFYKDLILQIFKSNRLRDVQLLWKDLKETRIHVDMLIFDVQDYIYIYNRQILEFLFEQEFFSNLHDLADSAAYFGNYSLCQILEKKNIEIDVDKLAERLIGMGNSRILRKVLSRNNLDPHTIWDTAWDVQHEGVLRVVYDLCGHVISSAEFVSRAIEENWLYAYKYAVRKWKQRGF
jgi:hypothetical protein